MGDKTFADIIFGIKDAIVDFFELVKEKITNIFEKISNKVDDTTYKVLNNFQKVQNKTYKSQQKIKDSVGANSSKLSSSSNNIFDKLDEFKKKIISKLGFDKYKKQYVKYQIGEDNFVPEVDPEDEKYKLFVGMVDSLNLNTKTDPNQIEVLSNYVTGKINPAYIKNTYSLAMMADDVIKTGIDAEVQLENGFYVSIENNGKNNVRMFINGMQETNCIKLGRTLSPEIKVSGLDEVIAKSSISLPGEEVAKSPLEVLTTFMQCASPGRNDGA